MNTDSFQVKVINHNDFDLEDRYDGVPYVVKANGKLNIPYEAACHIFGVDFAPDEAGQVDANLRKNIFQHLERRWGWNRTSANGSSKAIFEKIEFNLIAMTLVENNVDLEELGEPRETSPQFRQFPKPKVKEEVA